MLKRIPTVWRNGLVALLLLIAGGLIGYAYAAHSGATAPVNVRYAGGYDFVHPSLYTEVPEDISYPEYSKLKDDLTAAVAKAEGAHEASDVGIYFRDLDEGHWVGVNEDHTFAPGSLLKVATLLTTLRVTGGDSARLEAPIHVTFGPDYEPTQQTYYPPKDPITTSGSYTLDTLLSHLIVESDNGAADALDYYFGLSELNQTLTDLNVPSPGTAGNEPDTPREYSHFFRALYNGSYLGPAVSESALSLLSKTAFLDGLVAGVPQGTTVAHKWGEKTLDAGTNQLHDCGIVYLPDHPYFLCVMTKGADFPTLAGVIKDISSVVWTDVVARYK
jgi:beta-lactamase class A